MRANRNLFFTRFKYIKFSIRSMGIEYFVGEACYLLAIRALRKYLHPTLHDFYSSGFQVNFYSKDIIYNLKNTISDTSILNATGEYEFLLSELQKRLPNSQYGIDI